MAAWTGVIAVEIEKRMDWKNIWEVKSTAWCCGECSGLRGKGHSRWYSGSRMRKRVLVRPRLVTGIRGADTLLLCFYGGTKIRIPGTCSHEGD